MSSIKFQENLFAMSEWSGFLSKFGARMRVKMEKKATANISEVRKQTDFFSAFGWVNYSHQNYYQTSSTYHAYPAIHLKEKMG